MSQYRKSPIATLALALATLVVGAAGFFVGIKAEKSELPASASGASRVAAATVGTGAPGARPSASPSAGTSTAATTTTGAANIVGTVTSIDGSTLYVTDSSGDVVKVTTNTGTTVSKTGSGTVNDVAPGESVVIRGVQSSAGVYAAQSVSAGSAG